MNRLPACIGLASERGANPSGSRRGVARKRRGRRRSEIRHAHRGPLFRRKKEMTGSDDDRGRSAQGFAHSCGDRGRELGKLTPIEYDRSRLAVARAHRAAAR